MGISYTFVKAGVSNLNYPVNTTISANERIMLETRGSGPDRQSGTLDRIGVHCQPGDGHMVRTTDMEI